MSGPQLWVWIGADDDKLDVLRYVTATKKDILNQPIVRDAIAAKVARHREALAQYGRHEPCCARFGGGQWGLNPPIEGVACLCGLDAALAALKEAP